MDIIDIGLYVTAILFVASIGAAILLEVFNLAKNTKSLIFVGVIVVILVVIFGAAYGLSSGEVTTKYTALGIDSGSSRLIGAGLITLYVFLFVSVGGMIVSEIYKMLK